MTPVHVLFVCLGNICRSPLAEGAFRRHVEAAGLTDRFVIDSAGTGHWHAGEPPHKRSIAEARRHGVDLSGQRARQVARDDFVRFDHLVAMDESNRRDLLARARTPAERARITRLLDEVQGGPSEVPDPYYGGPEDYAHVWRLVDAATAALLARICAERGL